MKKSFYVKKGISPVIATALLLIMTVLVVVGFQKWYYDYSSSIFVNSELKSNSASSKSLSIEKIVGNNLYVINNIEEGLNISELKLENYTCNNLEPLNLGVNTINISDCLSLIGTSTPNIVLVTEDKIVQKKEFIKEINNLGSGSGGGSGGGFAGNLLIVPNGSHYDLMSQVFVDSSNNIYMVGSTYSDLDFGNGVDINNAGEHDFFIAKYNSSGVALWAKNPVSAPDDDYADSMYVDSSGNVYVTGKMEIGGIDFGNGQSVVNNCFNGFFLVKYNSVGVVQWADNYDCAVVDDVTLGRFVNGDSSGNIYVTGSYEDGWGAGTTFFLRKYDSSGNILWEKNSSFSTYSHGFKVFVDGSNNVYLGGSMMANSYDFGNGVILSKQNTNNFFVVKYNSAGIAQNVIYLDRADEDWLDSMYVDSSGNIYLGIQSGADIDFGGGVSFVADNFWGDFFLVKYNSAGVIQWGASHSGSDRSEKINSISVDGSGNVYVIGTTESNYVDFGNGLTFNSDGGMDYFVIKYNSAGTPVWLATSLNDTGYSTDEGLSTFLDGSNNLFIGVQTFSGNLEVGNGLLVSGLGMSEVFIYKYLSSEMN